MLIPSLLCVHVYTLSLLCLPSLLYLQLLVMATHSELVFYYMHAQLLRLPCLLSLLSIPIVCYIPTYQPKSQLDQDMLTQCATIWLPSLFCLPSLLQLSVCSLLEHACMSASVPSLSCRCMHALTYGVYLDCHASPQSSYLVCCTHLVFACRHVQSSTSILVYFPIYSLTYVQSLCCLQFTLPNQPACKLLELAYSMSALHAYPVCYA